MTLEEAIEKLKGLPVEKQVRIMQIIDEEAVTGKKGKPDWLKFAEEHARDLGRPDLSENPDIFTGRKREK